MTTYRANLHVLEADEIPDLADLLDDVTDVLNRYIHFTHPEQAWAVALWAAATYRYDDFGIFPRLAVRAGTRESGKTRLLEVTRELVRAGWGPIVGPSAAAFYRKIEQVHPTVLLDEVDRMFEKRAEDTAAILEVLNAGHTNGATVPRVVGVGTKQSVHDFDIFTPVALAGIAANWPDTLLDRSIVVTLTRRKADEHVDRYRRRDRSVPAAIGDHLGEAMGAIELAEAELPDHLSDRAQDNWESLFMVAAAAGGAWPSRVARAARVLGRAAARLMAEDERDEVLALGDMVAIFAERPTTTFIGSTDMVNSLRALEDSRWTEWHGDGLSTNRLATLLRSLEVRPVKPYGIPKRGYQREDVESVWARVGHTPTYPAEHETPHPATPPTP